MLQSYGKKIPHTTLGTNETKVTIPNDFNRDHAGIEPDQTKNNDEKSLL